MSDNPVSPHSFALPDGFVEIEPPSAFARMTGPFYRKLQGRNGIPVLAFRVRPDHLNSVGKAHGGMLATFLDMLLSHAVREASGRAPFTVRLVTDYLTPARLGDWIEGAAEVRRLTRSVAFVHGALQNGSRQVATAEGVFMLAQSQ